jgi:hypothetical protein
MVLPHLHAYAPDVGGGGAAPPTSHHDAGGAYDSPSSVSRRAQQQYTPQPSPAHDQTSQQPFPQSTNPQSQDTPQSNQSRSVKRPRPVKSCTECRKRKLKCSRLCPCSQCQKSGRVCKYAADADSGNLSDGSDGEAADGRPAKRNCLPGAEGGVIGDSTTGQAKNGDLAGKTALEILSHRMEKLERQLLGLGPNGADMGPAARTISAYPDTIRGLTVKGDAWRTRFFGQSSTRVLMNLVSLFVHSIYAKPMSRRGFPCAKQGADMKNSLMNPRTSWQATAARKF